MLKIINSSRRRKAQSMVEFALAFPILLILVLGIIEGGRMLFLISEVYAASREAARYGAGIGLTTLGSGGVPVYRDCNGILSAAERIGEFAGVQDSSITVDYDSGPATLKKGTAVCPNKSSTPTNTLTLGDRIVVTVDVLYSPIIPLLPIPSFQIRSQNAHTILSNVQIVGTPGTIVPGPSSTFTPTPTDTNTPTITPDPTDTPTGTLTPPADTSTPTLTPTPTLTLTPTLTPTGGPCDTNQLILSVSIINGQIHATINNKFTTFNITKITVSWSGNGTKLKTIVLNNGSNSTPVYSDNNGTSGPTFTISPSSLILPVGTSDLIFSFNNGNVGIPGSGPTVQIVVNNNLCTMAK